MNRHTFGLLSKISTYTAVTALLLLVGCVRYVPIENENRSAPTPFEGEWEWVKTCGGITGGCRTAEEAGYTATIEFEGDFYTHTTRGQGDSNRSGFKFTLTEKTMCGEPMSVVLHDGIEQFGLHLLEPDTLVVRTGCADGTASYYVRSY